MLVKNTREHLSGAIGLVLIFWVCCIVFWRLQHHFGRGSHPRRVAFHAVLLMVHGFQIPFWLSQTSSGNENLFGVGLGLMHFSISLLLCCVFVIVFQWTHVLSAGLVVQGRRRVNRWNALHPLFVLHLIELSFSITFAGFLITSGNTTPFQVVKFLERNQQYQITKAMTLVTAATDATAAGIIGMQLLFRLKRTNMIAKLRRKSMRQVVGAIFIIATAAGLLLLMDIPVVLYNIVPAWNQWTYLSYTLLASFAPSVLVSLSFLYLMRRTEERKVITQPSPRMDTMVASGSWTPIGNASEYIKQNFDGSLGVQGQGPNTPRQTPIFGALENLEPTNSFFHTGTYL